MSNWSETLTADQLPALQHLPSRRGPSVSSESETQITGNLPEYARAIRLALVRLLYEWEREA